MKHQTLQNDKINAQIKALEAKNGLRQRYLDFYQENGNLSQYAFQTAIARDELNIIKLKESLQ